MKTSTVLAVGAVALGAYLLYSKSAAAASYPGSAGPGIYTPPGSIPPGSMAIYGGGGVQGGGAYPQSPLSTIFNDLTTGWNKGAPAVPGYPQRSTNYMVTNWNAPAGNPTQLQNYAGPGGIQYGNYYQPAQFYGYGGNYGGYNNSVALPPGVMAGLGRVRQPLSRRG